MNSFWKDVFKAVGTGTVHCIFGYMMLTLFGQDGLLLYLAGIVGMNSAITVLVGERR